MNLPGRSRRIGGDRFSQALLYEYNQRDSRTQWNDILDNITDATGNVFMGVSMGCARCHDHKFDPIPTRDYYAMAGFFTSSETLYGIAANEKLTAPPTPLHVLETPPKVPAPADDLELMVETEKAGDAKLSASQGGTHLPAGDTGGDGDPRSERT